MNKIFNFPLTLLGVSVVWLFYMDASLAMLPAVLLFVGFGWWVRGHIE